MRVLGWLMSVFMGVALSACGAARPNALGMNDGRLAPCPSTPNCVSSQASDDAHRIEAMPYAVTRSEAVTAAATVIRAMPRTQMVTLRDDYLHAEYTSLVFRFVDDLELWFDDRNKLIHVRSASRVGRWDLGVNRRRVETLRDLLGDSLRRKAGE